ncbi:45670_t:CDS:2, partial [Gigaspora margarita]
APRHHEKLYLLKVDAPFDRVGIDIVGPFKHITENRNHYIIVAAEYLTKWSETCAIPDITAFTVAHFIYEDLIYYALCKIMTTHHHLATIYHPQTNGLTERFNKTLCSMLTKLVDDYKSTWDTLLPLALFAYHTLQNHTTKLDPFYLIYE